MLPIDKFLNHPYVFSNEWEDLIVFTYTRACQYDRAWDEVTRLARGIIFNKVTGELVARPFEKFFNLSELGFDKLPDLPFTVTEKLDGSLAVVYPYKDQYRAATKGSFKSDQAIWATDWLHTNVKMSEIKKGWTPLFEVIYPKNKIVIDYGSLERLTLLAYIENDTGKEMPYEDLVQEAIKLGAPVVRQETGFSNLDELYKYCKGLPPNKEGFVVTFSNGLKVKIKGDRYCQIHKMLCRMTPIAYWEAWDLALTDIPKEYLSQIPEEFREASDALHKIIYGMHWDPFNKYTQHFQELRALLGKDCDKRFFYEWAKEFYPEEYSMLIFLNENKVQKVWWKIHHDNRPMFNILPESIKGADRINRILQEN